MVCAANGGFNKYGPRPFSSFAHFSRLFCPQNPSKMQPNLHVRKDERVPESSPGGNENGFDNTAKSFGRLAYIIRINISKVQ